MPALLPDGLLLCSGHPASPAPPPPGGARPGDAPLPRAVVGGELPRRPQVEEDRRRVEGLRRRQRAARRGRLRLRARHARCRRRRRGGV
jgi:hypothetical protein